MTIDFKYAIGDAVYMCNEHGYQKSIIARIEITGEQHSIRYGFRREAERYWIPYGYTDPYLYYKEELIAKSRSEARMIHQLAKANYEKKQLKKKELEKQLEELED